MEIIYSKEELSIDIDSMPFCIFVNILEEGEFYVDGPNPLSNFKFLEW